MALTFADVEIDALHIQHARRYEGPKLRAALGQSRRDQRPIELRWTGD
jgi:hypothetical protein